MNYQTYQKLTETLCKMSDDDYTDLITDTARSHDPHSHAVHALCLLDQTSSSESDSNLCNAIARALKVHIDARHADATLAGMGVTKDEMLEYFLEEIKGQVMHLIVSEEGE